MIPEPVQLHLTVSGLTFCYGDYMINCNSYFTITKPTLMNKLILLFILSACSIYGYSQSISHDTAWFVELKDSSVLYSKKLSVRNSLSDGEYLLLDNNKKVPMNQVIRYRNKTGEYIRDRGPVETYRMENKGPHLFIYSRSFTYLDSTGYKEGRNYFFRKDSSEEMLAMNYKNLKDAMADNMASMHQMQAFRSNKQIAGISFLVSAVSLFAGMNASYRKNVRRYNENVNAKGYTSPLLYAGGGLFFASIAVGIAAYGHLKKAVDIYNQ